jgi:hypothetical protein
LQRIDDGLSVNANLVDRHQNSTSDIRQKNKQTFFGVRAKTSNTNGLKE